MSGYYARVSNISGAKSSVATSAYMSREKLKDDTMNRTFNYSGHEHDNTFSNITLCENAPKEWQDKEKLWNAVEEVEKGKNTRKAKQWILAVPQEMTQEQAEQAVKDFQEWMAEKGMCSQADIHEPDSKRSASQIEKNKHVHVMATQRLVNEQGEWEQIKEKKVYANCLNDEGKPDYNPDIPNDTEHRIPKIDPETGEQKIGARNRKEWERVKIQSNPLDNRELIEDSRAKWAEVCNKHLAAEQQIDHRSYERQGIDKISELHEGVGTHQDYDDRVEYNRTVKMANENMAAIKSVHPHEATEIKENLHGIRQSLEHDRDSRRSERDNQGTARSDTTSSGRKDGSERRTSESTNEYDELLSAVREFAIKESIGDSRERSKKFNESLGEYVAGTAKERESYGRIREELSDCIKEQSDIDRQTTGVRESLQNIRNRIRQAFENVRTMLKRTGKTDRGIKNSIAESIKEQRGENTMSVMNRFDELAANQEKENVLSTGNSNAELERLSVREKLRKYEQEVREGRTEQLQSEKNQETNRKRGIHR